MFSQNHDARIGRQQQDVRWQMNFHQVGGVSDASAAYDSENPAVEGGSLSRSLSEERLSMDDEIKRLEAQYAQQARERNQLQRQAPAPSADTPERRSVNFADEAFLYGSDQSEEEVEYMWYNRAELNQFKNERKEVVKALKRAHFNLSAVEATGRYCLRGYEPYFSMEVNKAMKYARTLVLSLVLQEQERQRADGTYFDPDSMEQAVAPASEWARENALQLGRNDEVEAFDEYAGFFQDDVEFGPFDCYNDESTSCTESRDYNNNNTINACATSIAAGSTSSCSHFSQDDDCRSMVSHPHGNDSLAYYAAHHHDNNNDNLETASPEQDHAATLLGKRKDAVEQPPFESRPHVQQQQEQEETDEIAERLDSALKLVAALKATSSISMRR